MKRSRAATPSSRNARRTGPGFLTTTELPSCDRAPFQAALGWLNEHIAEGADSVRETVEPITGVPQAGHDVADLVEPLVETREHQGARHLQIFEHLRHPCDALRGRYQTDAGDVVGTASNEILNRCCQCATSGQHWIEHITLPPRQVGRQALGVHRGMQRDLVAHQADEPHSAVGINRVIPSSIPSPARRMGTTSGRGDDSLTPSAGATGVCTVTGVTRTWRVASYASSVTSSSVSRRKVGKLVVASRNAVSLCATRGWSTTVSSTPAP